MVDSVEARLVTPSGSPVNLPRLTSLVWQPTRFSPFSLCYELDLLPELRVSATLDFLLSCRGVSLWPARRVYGVYSDTSWAAFLRTCRQLDD